MNYRVRGRRRQHSSLAGRIAAVLLALVLIFGVGAMIVSYNVPDTKVCTVSEKDRTKNNDGSSDARVYTEDCGTLKVADSLIHWEWSSADTYAQIKPGERYEFKTVGWRIPFFSSFPNVIDVQPAN